jgi:hypothetical protein
MMVECLINKPTTEQTLILIMGDLICSSILFSRTMKALLIREFETLELTIIDSKYWSVLIFSLTVVLLAMEV